MLWQPHKEWLGLLYLRTEDVVFHAVVQDVELSVLNEFVALYGLECGVLQSRCKDAWSSVAFFSKTVDGFFEVIAEELGTGLRARVWCKSEEAVGARSLGFLYILVFPHPPTGTRFGSGVLKAEDLSIDIEDRVLLEHIGG